MSWPHPRALLLDAMGTLIDLRSSVGSTYAAVAADHGVLVTAEAIDQVFPATYRAAPPLAFKGLEGDVLLGEERSWWVDLIDTVLREAGALSVPPELGSELFERFADPSLWYVHADVPEQLGRWHRSGLRLAVVSNFDSRLHTLLDGLDLSRWLDVVVVSSQAGAAKPSPEPFLQALAALELEPEQAWHVGDSPEDAEGARAAGLRCVIVQRP